MLEQFLNHINENSKLIGSNQKILLAVSGGIDSMVMLDLFRQTSHTIAVAHCNFQLRGEASDGDEEFVKEYCYQYQIPFYSKRFQTRQYTDEHGISIQMGARDLRYAWFNELSENYNFDLLATAHHLNDNLETVLLNFVRGTGLDGLTGIPERNGKIIRPLLPFSKSVIEDYANRNSIQWREDASNQTSNYNRNFIRHQITPLLKQLNPSLEEVFLLTTERLVGAKQLTELQIRLMGSQSMEQLGSISKIKIESVLSSPSPSVLLWYFIKDYGFSFDQCKTIVEPHETGSSFYSSGFRITIDREYFILTEAQQSSHESVQIGRGQQVAHLGNATLSFEWVERTPAIEKNAAVAMMDADALEFPLCWRNWEHGDQFVPLGMQQHKKVSDFLIDQKVSLPEKDEVTVLLSGGKICWVVGHRISDHFKINDQTHRSIIIRNIQ